MKTGVLLDNTNISDLNYHVMTEMNNRVGGMNDLILFITDISSMVIRPNFAIMCVSKISSLYDGILISTTLETSKILTKTVTNSKKVYYLYSLEWLYKPFNFNEVYDILHSDLKLIVRSESQREFLKRIYKVENVDILEKFDLEKIHGICA